MAAAVVVVVVVAEEVKPFEEEGGCRATRYTMVSSEQWDNPLSRSNSTAAVDASSVVLRSVAVTSDSEEEEEGGIRSRRGSTVPFGTMTCASHCF